MRMQDLSKVWYGSNRSLQVRSAEALLVDARVHCLALMTQRRLANGVDDKLLDHFCVAEMPERVERLLLFSCHRHSIIQNNRPSLVKQIGQWRFIAELRNVGEYQIVR